MPLLGPAYNLFARRILPRVGGWVTGNRGAYRYLESSSARFPCREDFLRLMEETGRFESADCRPLSGGIAYLYRGRVGG